MSNNQSDDNPIPDRLRCDHLFLLVGTNPLPNWVATRLLLRQTGQLYLVNSQETLDISRRLAKYATRHGYSQAVYVPVGNSHKKSSVERAIGGRVAGIRGGVIGLNYTGGTKVMSVHGYRTIEAQRSEGLPPVIFSYLDPTDNEMIFEESAAYPDGAAFKIGFAEQVRLSLEELCELHDDFSMQKPEKTVSGKAYFDFLLRYHLDKSLQQSWQRAWSRLIRRADRPDKLKSKTELGVTSLELPAEFQDFQNALSPTTTSGSITLGEVASSLHTEFSSLSDLLKWLQGRWLEHYVLQQLLERQDECRIHDCGRNISPEHEQYKFEADIGAMRGYQLHLISCTTDSDKGGCKLKLFEVYQRATQLGGDEARAGLVCCSDNPASVEAEMYRAGIMRNRVRVFGRIHLTNLGQYLGEWLSTGAQ